MLQAKAMKYLSHLNYGIRGHELCKNCALKPWNWLEQFDGNLVWIEYACHKPECPPRARFDNCGHASISICDLVTFDLFMESMCRKKFHVFNTCKFLTKVSKQDSLFFVEEHSLENSFKLINTCKFFAKISKQGCENLTDVLTDKRCSFFCCPCTIMAANNKNNNMYWLLLYKLEIKEDFELIEKSCEVRNASNIFSFGNRCASSTSTYCDHMRA